MIPENSAGGMKVVTILVLSMLIMFLMLLKACAENFSSGNLDTRIVPGAERSPGSQSRKAAINPRSKIISPAPTGRAPIHGFSRQAEPVISARFLDAVAMIESQGRDSAVGDGGKARGAFQFHAGTWEHVSRLAAAGRVSFALAHDPRVSRVFALEYFRYLSSYLTAHGKPVNHANLYAAWNVGPTSFRRRGFSVRNCPLTTRHACAKIERMMK